MTLRETIDANELQRKLDREIRHAAGEEPIPTVAILELGMARGDILIEDSRDDSRTDGRGVSCWITAENWRTGEGFAVQHLWGPSTYDDGTDRQLDLLIEICQWGVARDTDPRFRTWPLKAADTPIRFAVSSRALPALAVRSAGATVDARGRYGVATMRTALVALLAARAAR